MATLYILAIGGSGARVVRSLAMLLPTLPNFGRFSEVKPVLIDADEKNGSLDRAGNILSYYENLNSNAELSSSGYFKTKIEKHDNKYIHLVDVRNNNSSKFEDYIDLTTLKKNDNNTARLIELLFSGKSSAGTELLDLDMDVGFQGNPNIGSVVMSDWAEGFLSKMTLQSTDEVLFITSIFGGTGAAGFPAFLSRMRKADKENPKTNEAELTGVKMGAISLLPYYGLPEKKSSSELDGSHFIPKTKSALNYYLGNIYTNEKGDRLKEFKKSDIEYFCYIAHEYIAKQPKNERGGKSGSKEKTQDNPAFFAELMAALAVLDYVTETLERGKIKFKQIADIKSNTVPITVDNTIHLDEKIASQIKGHLIKLSLISKILNKEFLKKSIDKKYAWTKNLNITKAIDENLVKFFAEYEEWKTNLKTYGQKFNSPEVNVSGYEIHTKLDRLSKNSSSKGIGALVGILNKMEIV